MCSRKEPVLTFDNSLNDRGQKEKEWHNRKFAAGKIPAFDKHYAANKYAYNVFENMILKELNPDKTVFLDYGCGRGNHSRSFTDKVKKLIGIDISEEGIKQATAAAKESGIKNAEFFVMDAAKTTFGNEEFDVIRGSAILHHLELEPSLLEIRRLLKSAGGMAFFAEPLDTNPLIKLFRKLTPDLRSRDEQPLRIKDIRTIRSVFPKAQIYYFSFFTLLAIPFRNSKHFDKVLSFLYAADKAVLNEKSPFKRLAWICLIVMKK